MALHPLHPPKPRRKDVYEVGNPSQKGLYLQKHLSTRRSLPQIVYDFSRCSHLTTNTLEEYAVRYVLIGSLARLSIA